MLMTTPDTAIKRAGAAIAADAAHKAKPPTDADERKAKAAIEAVGYRELCNALDEMLTAFARPIQPATLDRRGEAWAYAFAVSQWIRGLGKKPTEPDFLKYGDQS